MPYINYVETDNNYNYYKPSNNLRNLFENLVIIPLRESLPVETNEYERDLDWNYKDGLRRRVLDRGSTDFDTSSSYQNKVYTPEHKVLLYCATYMSMHLYSSYHLYSVHLMKHRHVIESENIVFIDFGCGPLTSGIAFWAAAGQCNITAGQHNITHIGIDISQTMCNKAAQINQYGPFGYTDPFYIKPFYENNYLIKNYNDLPQLLNDIEKGNPTDTLIIFNFSYMLAQVTFQGDINRLINVLHDIVQVNRHYKIGMVYQNIEGGDENWNNLKTEIINYPYFPLLIFTAQNDTETMHVKYERLMERTVDNRLHVSCDYFYN